MADTRNGLTTTIQRISIKRLNYQSTCIYSPISFQYIEID